MLLKKIEKNISFLKEKEQNVVILLCETGLSQVEISKKINVSERSINKIISSLKYIFEANNLAQLGANWIKYKYEDLT
jgi:DNA-directed RNA polymerase specialized sigma subunit